MDRMFAKWGGAEVLRKAVSGMLPKNKLRKPRLERLKGERIPYFCSFFSLFWGGGWREDLQRFRDTNADFWLIAFEGLAHPYKRNIVKLQKTTSISTLPEVQARLEEMKVTEGSAEK